MSRPLWTPWEDRSRVLRVTFAVANQPIGIAHGMDRTPEGFIVLWGDGPVYAAPPSSAWGDQVAYLEAPNANTHALVMFITFSEVPYVP